MRGKSRSRHGDAREPRVSTLSSEKLLHTRELLMPWHLCSNYPKEKEPDERQMRWRSSSASSVPQPAFYAAFWASVARHHPRLWRRKASHFHYPAASCVSFRESPSHFPRSDTRSLNVLSHEGQAGGKMKVSVGQDLWIPFVAPTASHPAWKYSL